MASHGLNIGNKTNAFNVVDLFSGVGGLSLGSARAGLAVRGAVDIDPEAISAHGRNFPNTIHLKTDVAKLTGQSLKRQLGLNGDNITGIIGGPPCQGFSAIGRRDLDDARNGSFVGFFRMVSEAIPKFFLAENVPGIMQERYRDIRERALSFVERKYAILSPMTLTAHEYGAATIRKRVFFFGYLPDAMERLTVDSFKAPAGIETVYVKDALRGLPTKIDPSWQREEQGWRVVHAHEKGHYAQRLHGHVPVGVGDQVALERLKGNEASGFLGTVHTGESG